MKKETMEKKLNSIIREIDISTEETRRVVDILLATTKRLNEGRNDNNKH